MADVADSCGAELCEDRDIERPPFAEERNDIKAVIADVYRKPVRTPAHFELLSRLASLKSRIAFRALDL